MNNRFAFLLLLVMFVCVVPAQAQVGTPQTPTPGGLVYGMDAEVLFPEAVRFSIALDTAANDIAIVVLTLRIAGQEPIAIPISVAQAATVRDPFTELVYVWDIPRDTPPSLFSSVGYEWQITRTNDQVLAVQSSFEFTDPRILWTLNSATTSRITFTVPTENFNTSMVSLRNDVQAAYDLMNTNTGEQPPFHVMIYPVRLNPGCDVNSEGEAVARGMISGEEVPCNNAQAEAVYRASGIDVLQLQGTGTENALRVALADLLTERFYGTAWSTNDVPLWFERGLALFYLPTNKLDLLQIVQRAARSNQLFTLEEMNAEPTENAELWRAQSYGMVLYSAEQAGVTPLFSLARTPGASFAESYQSAIGLPLTNLINSWQRWLFSTAAEDAYAYFPQLATTSTPTFTPTATAERPTATPTLTQTPTNTPTATNTGVPERILPTLTETRTPTSAPATVTPRPAGSLRTPTPTPTATTSFVQPGQAGGFAALGLILLVLAGLSLIYVRQSRR